VGLERRRLVGGGHVRLFTRGRHLVRLGRRRSHRDRSRAGGGRRAPREAGGDPNRRDLVQHGSHRPQEALEGRPLRRLREGPKLEQEVGAGGVPSGRGPLEQAGQRRDELRTSIRDLRGFFFGLAARHLLGDSGEVSTLEEALAGEELVEHRPHREQVGGGLEVAGAAPDLRGDVPRRALDDAAGGRLDVQGALDQPPVGDLEDASAVHQHVARLQVAVHDAEPIAVVVGGVVGVVEGLGQVDGGFDGGLDRDLVLALAQRHQERVQVRPVDELHRDVQLAVVGPHLVDVDDARMLEAPADAGLVDQGLLLGLHLARRRLQQLEGLALAEPQVALFDDLPHLGRGAPPQRPLQRVGPEDLSGFVRRRLIHGVRGQRATGPLWHGMDSTRSSTLNG